MNISASKIEDCDGGVRDDRPDYVDDLTLKRKIGWKEGSPVVGDPIKLSENVNNGYEHYKRGGELFKPDAGKFLGELSECEMITSLSDLSRELNTDESTIEKTCQLHDIDLIDGSDDSPEQEGETSETFVFPSGETFPKDLLADPIESDVRVLSVLLGTNGMSTQEVAQFLTDRLDRNVRERDVRSEAEKHAIL